jgi:hypothetical protein
MYSKCLFYSFLLVKYTIGFLFVILIPIITLIIESDLRKVLYFFTFKVNQLWQKCLLVQSTLVVSELYYLNLGCLAQNPLIIKS